MEGSEPTHRLGLAFFGVGEKPKLVDSQESLCLKSEREQKEEFG